MVVSCRPGKRIVKHLTHLHSIYHGLQEGYVAVWHKPTKQTRWSHISQLAEAASYMEAAAATEDVYFGWGLQKDALGPDQRGSAKSVVAVGGIMFDADLKADVAGVHAEQNLPASLEEVRDFLREIKFIEPTAIRNSGNGLYLDWLTTTPQVFTTEDERAAFAKLSARLHIALISAANKLRGWSFDNTSDLCRVTRMPGTLNHKTSPAKPVTLLEYDPERRYTVDQIGTAVLALEARFPIPQKPKGKPGPKAKKLAADNDNIEKKPDFDVITAGCAWAKSTVESAATLPEPDWYALASIAGRCGNGREVFHQVSEPHPGYSREEADRKLDHALEAAGPRNCDNIRDALGFTGCQNCLFAGKVKSPIELGYHDKVSIKLIASNVMDVKTGTYQDLSTDERLLTNSFILKHQHLVSKGTPHGLLARHKLTRKVDRIDYLPGKQSRFVLEPNGTEVFNTWRPGALKPVDGDVTILMEHMAYIVPDPGECEHVLDCLAHTVQRPGEKIKHAILLIGKQGTGKSFFVDLMKSLVGVDNVKTAESEHLVSEWTAQLCNRQLLMVEELIKVGRMEVYNRLKTLITQETVTVNEKNIPLFDARTPRLIMAFSNHLAPITLQDDDRRFFVVGSDAPPKERAYYDRLFAAGLEEAAAFLAFLLKRDLSSFNPSEPAPITASKQYIIQRSKSELVQEIECMTEEGACPFWCDIVESGDVARRVSDRSKGRIPSTRATADALRELGAVQLSQMRLGAKARVRPWAWRNPDRWAGATTDEIRQEMLKVNSNFHDIPMGDAAVC
jgi:hypothetical protein